MSGTSESGSGLPEDRTLFLQDDLLVRIFSYCDWRDVLASASRVSKRWLHIIRMGVGVWCLRFNLQRPIRDYMPSYRFLQSSGSLQALELGGGRESLANPYVSDAATLVAILSRLPCLTSLSLSSMPSVTDDILLAIQSPGLVSLDVSRTGVTLGATLVQYLARFSRLHTLVLDSCRIHPQGFMAMCVLLRNLQNLSMCNCVVSSLDLMHLGRLTSLRSLALDNTSLASMEVFPYFPQPLLQRLSLQRCMDLSARLLPSLPHSITDLSLINTPHVERLGVELLQLACPNLQKFSLGNGGGFEPEAFGGMMRRTCGATVRHLTLCYNLWLMVAFPSLSNLESLSWSDSSPRDDTIVDECIAGVIQRNPQLRSLDIRSSHSELTDTTLRNVCGLAYLYSLELSLYTVTRESFRLLIERHQQQRLSRVHLYVRAYEGPIQDVASFQDCMNAMGGTCSVEIHQQGRHRGPSPLVPSSFVSVSVPDLS
mmetsp:Transcript_14512/g.24097  ORF Transcript_14512/g.24097 Transcript_14512/m.24097 type:complete len:483 (-) Transcript_14512:59-1507(-)